MLNMSLKKTTVSYFLNTDLAIKLSVNFLPWERVRPKVYTSIFILAQNIKNILVIKPIYKILPMKALHIQRIQIHFYFTAKFL